MLRRLGGLVGSLFGCATALAFGCSEARIEERSVDAGLPPERALSAIRGAAIGDAPASYDFARTAPGASATNAALALHARFDDGAVSITPEGSAWSLTLRLARFGRTATPSDMASGTRPSIDRNRLAIVRGAGVTEWWVHGAEGLEQGFELGERPAGDGEVVLELALDGLTAELVDGARTASLRDPRGREVLRYGKLAAGDADGRAVAARMEVTPGRIAIRLDDRAARYPITVDPLVFAAQQAKLFAGDPAAGDGFGVAVAASGDTLLVGASGKSGGRVGWRDGADRMDEEHLRLVAALMDLTGC
jgi:hypothetical protein